MKKDYKLIAFDLDGTLTQHRTKLGPENKAVLDKLAKNHKLLMVGAGACHRIFGQMNEYPIDIFGNYGMEVAKYNPETKQLDIVDKAYVEPDRARTEKICQEFRDKYGFTEYAGDAVEFHASGMITFPLIGTKAKIEDKLSFDPDRSRRKVFYDEVKAAFPDYTVFIGGSSSFDLAPHPYNKLHALDRYCEANGITHADILFCGDDYGVGGNDEQVYNSDIDFVKVDDYTKLGEYLSFLLED